MEFKRMRRAFFVYAYRGYNRDKKRSIVLKMGEISMDYEPSPDLFGQMKPSEIEEAWGFIRNGRAAISFIDDDKALSGLPETIDKAIRCAERPLADRPALAWMDGDALAKMKSLASLIHQNMNEGAKD